MAAELSRSLQELVDKLLATKSSVLVHLDCPVCLTTCRPPVFMCDNGHIVCADCRALVDACPTCRAPGCPDRRNILADGVSEVFGRFCPFRAAGCASFVYEAIVATHKLDCLHRFKCGFCDARGDVSGLTDHLLSNHEERITVGRRWQGDVTENSRLTGYIACYQHLFRCSLFYNANDKGLRFWVQFLGPRESTTRYTAWIKCTSVDRETKYKCSYGVPCFPTGKVISAIDQVVFHDEQVYSLVEGRRTVKCQIKIEESNDG